jgi:RNA polymerase sigma-70 factor (ECF subfamily)
MRKYDRSKLLVLKPSRAATAQERELYKVWVLARSEAERWNVGASRAEEIADRIMDRVGARRRDKPSFLADAADLQRFLYITVKRRVLRGYKREGRFVDLDSVADDLAAPVDYESVPITTTSDDRLDYIEIAVKQLPERCREVWYLRTQEGFSRGEIAAALGISVRTVDGHVQLATQRIRETTARYTAMKKGDRQ